MTTLIDMDGFSHQTLDTAQAGSSFTGVYDATQQTATLSFDASVLRTAQHICSLKGVAAGNQFGSVSRNIAGTQHIVASFYFRCTVAPGTTPIGLFTVNSSTVPTGLHMNTAGNLIWNVNSGNGQQTSAGTYADGYWHRVDIHLDQSGTTWKTDVTIDGVAQTQSSQGSHVATNMTLWKVGGNANLGNITAGTFWFADLVVSVTSGDYPIGPHVVWPLYPNGEGTDNLASQIVDNASGTSNLYQAVDDWNGGTPDTSTWITQNATDVTAYAEFTHATPAAATIWDVLGIIAGFTNSTTADTTLTVRTQMFDSGGTLIDTWQATAFDYSGSTSVLGYYRALVVRISGGWTTSNLAAAHTRWGKATINNTRRPRLSAVMYEYASPSTVHTNTHTTDAIIKATLSVSHTTNAIILKTSTVTHSTDAIIKATLSKTHSTNAIIKKTSTVTHSTDAIIKKAATVTHSTDAIIKKAATVTHSTDADVKATLSVTHSTDAIIKKAATVTHSTDAIIKKAATVTHSTDADVKATLSVTHSTDAYVVSRVSISHDTDAIISSPTTVVTHSTDAIIVKSFTVTQSADAVVKKTIAVTQSADAVIKATLAVTHSTDAVIKKAATVTHSTDAVIKKAATVTQSADAVIKATLTRTHSTDAVVKKAATVTHSTDAILRLRTQVSQDTDALIKATLRRVHSTDAVVLKTKTRTHSTDAEIKKTLAVSHATDAIVAGTVQHSTDAVIVRTSLLQHSTDAVVSGIKSITHDTDAYVVLRTSVSHGSDAFLIKPKFYYRQTESAIYENEDWPEEVYTQLDRPIYTAPEETP